jgi:hypothetical protein
MAPANSVPSPPGVPAYTSPLDPEQEARLKAEARAYALSSSSSSKGSKRKLPASAPNPRPNTRPGGAAAAAAAAAFAATQKPTSLSIHRPDRPQKMQKPNLTYTPDAATMPPPSTTTTATQPFFKVFDEDEDDYQRFVKSLGLDDSLFATLDNDDEDFHLSDIEEEDDDDEDEEDLDVEGDQGESTDEAALSKVATQQAAAITPSLSSPLSSSPMMLPDFETDLYKSLEEELGSLLEEDMEAAVQSLMTSKKPGAQSPSSAGVSATASPKTPKTTGKKQAKDSSETKNNSPATPLRETARQGTRTQVTYQQSQQLRRLLTRHYQLLVQQAVLAVRAAQMQKLHKDRSDFLSGETADDLAEILDGAVGMLQDLDQNRKDAIRNSIQLSPTGGASEKGRRTLLPRFTDSSEQQEQGSAVGDRRLTRSAFSKTLEQNGVSGTRRTAFDIPGLMKLKETFATIDESVEGVKGSCNILDSTTHTEACKLVLRQAAANLDESYIPGVSDLADNFCEVKEFLGDSFEPPCSEEQQVFLRRNRNLFTSGEDNLVLRGVNLYGEKQWILIADRYLPDRSVNIISQRYSKLCVMLYKAHGIDIDSKGDLEEPPKLESVDDIDEIRVKELELGTVEPPAILNVHRWSLEEDLTLLKAVPIMGHMWAELGARLIPHRDRGHLRKRYQVLERRVKATVVRSSKGEPGSLKVPRQPMVGRKGDNSSSHTRPPLFKSAPKPTPSRSLAKKASARKPVSEDPPMSIEKAAASLAFLRPPAPEEPKKTLVEGKVEPVKPQKKTATPQPVVPNPPAQHQPATPPPSGLKARKASTSASASKLNLPLNEQTSSRAAFERLVEGTNEEWSQMSRMKRMLENDAESQAADAIVSHLAKSPGPRAPVSKLPQIHMDANSMSGLSILQSEASKQASSSTSKVMPAGAETSIMSRVLRGTSKGVEPETKPSGNAESPSTAWAKLDKSPRKTTFKNISKPSTPGPPTTPKRTNFFSASGTPIGLSPGFRPSPGILRDGGAITLTPNPTYSPAPSAVMRLMSEPSGDEIRFCDFQISEDSRKGLEGVEVGVQQTHDPTPPPLTPSKNSLMMDDSTFDAMEAISALNSLSNSPFRPPKRNGEEEPGKGGRKSLFASVVGGTKEKDPKARLQF